MPFLWISFCQLLLTPWLLNERYLITTYSETAVHVIADCEWSPAYSTKWEWHGPIDTRPAVANFLCSKQRRFREPKLETYCSRPFIKKFFRSPHRSWQFDINRPTLLSWTVRKSLLFRKDLHLKKTVVTNLCVVYYSYPSLVLHLLIS